MTATDSDTNDDVERYAITAGADRSKFRIDSASGALSFASAPDHENPTDGVSSDPVNSAGNNQYVVVVSATSGTGSRARTASQTIVVTVTDDAGEPSEPTGLSANPNGQTRIDLSWQQPANVGDSSISGYKIEYSSDRGRSWTDLVGITNTDETIHSDTSLRAGTTRSYRVSAINAVGVGPRSNVATATTPRPPPDTRSPSVSGVAIRSSPAKAGTYALGESVSVTLTFDESVRVTGRPALGLTVGDATRPAAYASGSGTSSLGFAYSVMEGDFDPDGVSVDANSLTLEGGTIADGANNPATLTHEAVAPHPVHRVDGVGPALAETGGAVVRGDTLTLTWGEPLDADSVPGADSFALAGGDAARTVIAVSVSGSAVELTLRPEVARSEAGLTLSYTAPSGANATPIEDAVSNAAADFANRAVANESPLAAPDVNEDGRIDEDDALVMYYAYALEELLGDGTSGSGVERFRQVLLSGRAGPSGAGDTALLQMLSQANDWKESGASAGGDVNGDGGIDEDDALVMYYAYALEELLGDGTSGSGVERFRQVLLSGRAGPSGTGDAALREMLRQANELRAKLP